MCYVVPLLLLYPLLAGEFPQWEVNYCCECNFISSILAAAAAPLQFYPSVLTGAPRTTNSPRSYTSTIIIICSVQSVYVVRSQLLLAADPLMYRHSEIYSV